MNAAVMSKEELGIVAGLLFNPDLALKLIDQHGITGDDFGSLTLRDIFRAIITLPPEILLQGEVRDVFEVIPDQAIAEMGGHEALFNALDNNRLMLMLYNAAESIRAKTERRRLSEAAQAALMELSQGQDVSKVRETLRPFVAGSGAVNSRAMDLGAWVARVVDEEDRGVERLGITTGVFELDGFTGRFRGGEVWIVAARPGAGKTSLACQVVLSTALSGVRVAFFSAEMTGEALARRWMSSVMGTRTGTPGQVLDAQETLARLPVRLEEVGARTVADVGVAVRREAALGTKLVVVDYLQLLDAGLGPRASSYERVTAVSKALREMAIENRLCILALAQLNRGHDGTIAAEPQLSNLRDSGQIEQDAELVFLLHRHKEDSSGDMKCIVAKNREGPTGEVMLVFDWELNRFRGGVRKEDRGAEAAWQSVEGQLF